MKSLTKILTIVMLMCALTVLVSANAWADAPTISVSGSNSLTVGQAVDFTATVSEDGYSIAWHIDPNDGTLTVNSEAGNVISVTAAKPGSVSVWASVNGTDAVSNTVPVNVEDVVPNLGAAHHPHFDPLPTLTVTGNGAPEIGQQVVYTATVGNDAGYTIAWHLEPNNGTMSYVGEDSRTLTLKAEKAGQVYVWASINGFDSVTDGVSVTVPRSSSPKFVEKVSINNPGSIFVGQEKQLTATVIPGDADNKSLLWTSNAPNIASVTEDGYLIARQVGGPVTITATAKDRSYVYDAITVYVLNTNVSISSSNGNTIPVNGTTVLTAVDTENTHYNWKWYFTEEAAKDYAELSPDPNGGNTAVLKMKKAGRSVTVLASNTNGKSATITINAGNTPSSALGLSAYNLALPLGGTGGVLRAYYGNSDVTNACTWTDYDPSIISVYQGKITPLKAGTTRVRAWYSNIPSEYCTVTVGGTTFFTITAVSNNATFDGVNPLYFVTSAAYDKNAYPSVTIVGANNEYSRNLVYGSDFRVDCSPDGHMMITVNPVTLHNLPQSNFHNIAVSYGGQIAYARFWRAGTSYNVYGVRTGDDNNIALWSSLCIISFAGAAAIVITKRKDIFAK